MSGDNASIRIRGQAIADLPHIDRMRALIELSRKEEYERNAELDQILRRYPKWDPVQLQASIRQMEDNVEKLKATQLKEYQEIKKYRQLISQCEARDQELRERGFL